MSAANRPPLAAHAPADRDGRADHNGGPGRGARVDTEYDAVIIGSGFGGAMCAAELVDAGWRVLLIERGDWVPRGPRNWSSDQAMGMAPAWNQDAWLSAGAGHRRIGAFQCVGGPSVFYGGASVRYRVRDFDADPAIVGDSGALWPVTYADLEPWYHRAERLIGVVGDDSDDPTAPPRSSPLRNGPPLSMTSQRIAAAARSLGLTPSALPLAINWRTDPERGQCVRCTTCDAFACAIGAKNDLATAVLPRLIGRGLTVVANTTVVRLHVNGRQISRIDCIDTRSGSPSSYRGRHVVLAAGAIATPHLVLASGLDRLNPAGSRVGRYLMRHCNALVYGLFREPPNPDRTHHKQLAFFDAYFGSRSAAGPEGKLGCIQQIHAPPTGLVASRLPRFLRGAVPPLVDRSTGLLVIAEDQPRPDNRVMIDTRRPGADGLPQAVVMHRYTSRDLRARRALVGIARSILREAGAITTVVVPIRTFSHALGTMRMGAREDESPVDIDGRFRGLDNVWVTDASVLPTAAAVNPSLTIAANALRIGRRIAGTAARPARPARTAPESCPISLVRIDNGRDRRTGSAVATVRRYT